MKEQSDMLSCHSPAVVSLSFIFNQNEHHLSLSLPPSPLFLQPICRSTSDTNYFSLASQSFLILALPICISAPSLIVSSPCLCLLL